jgi:hypothetical protein
MTNTPRLVFAIAATVFAALSVLMNMQSTVQIGGKAISLVADVLGLNELPLPLPLAVLIIPFLYLYLAFNQRRRS